jgi:hypothetical protein
MRRFSRSATTIAKNLSAQGGNELEPANSLAKSDGQQKVRLRVVYWEIMKSGTKYLSQHSPFLSS